jgi:fructose-bisphosphate aldolase, class II
MAQKTLAFYLEKAKKEGWALPQFNFSTPEQLKGMVEAAQQQHAPLLLGTSEGEAAFLGVSQAVALVESYKKETGLPVFLNFDHGKSIESVKKAIDAGYDAVHIDASGYVFEESIKVVKKVVQLARKKGVSVVEGEFQEVPGGHSVLHKAPLNKGVMTDPAKAKEFVRKTGVNSVAVLVGSVHGIVQQGNPGLDLERLQKIQKQVQCFLVLHGGSGTPQRDLLQAVKLGVVKVNVNTELRIAFAKALHSSLLKNPEEIVPYKLLAGVVEETRRVTEQKMKFFGSSNKV